MKKVIIVMSLVFISCTKQDIQSIVIQNDKSSEINLFEGDYVVHFMSKKDSKFQFPIQREEIIEIKNSYNYENIFNYGKEPLIVEEKLVMMPPSDTKYIINFSDGTKQTITIRTDFVKNPLDIEKYKHLKKFINKINNVINSKKEIQSAPRSDIIYM